VVVMVGSATSNGIIFAVASSNLTLTGSLNTARMFQTSTLLDNGMVLIAGGVDGFDYNTISSAELYNPTSGTFAYTGSLNIGRIFNTATLLNNGKVLIVGGTDCNWNNIATAEVYDPVAGTFSPTSSLNTARDSHTATVLNNGKVLIAGGVSSNGDWITGLAANAEIYDPVAGTFSSTGSLNTARDTHTATLLNNGQVLIVGGLDVNGNSLASAEIYDPTAGTFALTGSLSYARAVHTASLLNNGMVLIAGGYDTEGNAVANAELYNPATGTFTVTGSMNAPRYDMGESTLLSNGMVLIAGGQDTNGNTLASVELYDPAAGTFSVTGGMNSTRQSLTTTLLPNGQVLIAAGMDYYANVLTSTELYQPSSLTPPGLVSIAVSPQNSSIAVGASQQMVATGTFSDNSTETLESATWSTSSSAVATVSNDASNYGNVLAVAPGTVTVTACAGTVCGSTSMTVLSPPSITSFTPSQASYGTMVSVVGASLGGSGLTTVVTLASVTGGTIVAPLTGASPTNVSFVVPTGAVTGPITVTVNGQSATSATSLTIVAASTFTLTAAPSSVTLLPGQTTTVSVSLASTNGFTLLATLGVSGLPAGVTASFQPPAITAGGSSVLTLTAPASQAPSSSALTISASATVQGISQTLSVTVTLNVQGPGGVAFQGRAAVTDPSHDIPLVGLTVRFLGVDYQGNSTGCTASTQTDSSGNFVFFSLPSACSGPQMVEYDPSTVSSPPGRFSGVNLSYVLTPGQVTTPGLVVHLPNVATVQTVQVQQNSSTDQTFTFSNIPGVTITVYAGTTLSLADGTQPNPFPLSVVEIPYEQVPDYMPPNPTQDPVFAMSIEPFNSSASQPVAVSFPNRSNLPPGSAMPLTSLNPTLGMMVAYGTGTVSPDGSQVVPDLDPSRPGHLYGISHFDWHFPLCNAPNSQNPSPDPMCPCAGGDAIDPASGLVVENKADIAFGGARAQVAITRTFRGMSGNPGPFGIGTNYNYNIMLSTVNVSTGLIELIMPDGNQYPFIQQTDGTFINTTIPSMRGAVLTKGTCVTTAYGYGCGGSLRWKDGTVYHFQSLLIGQPWAGFLTSITDPNGNTTTLVHDAAVPSNIDQVTDPVGRALNISWVTYGSNGAYGISSITDPIGRSLQYTYNSAGMLSTVTDANGGVTSYGYDSNNNLTSITDPRGNTYQNFFDSNGRVIKQIAPDGGITTFSYTQSNPTIQTSPVIYTLVTDPLGNQTTYHFNPAGFLLDVTDALGEKTVYTRDPATNLVQSVTDPLGRTTAYTYDANGNTTSTTRLAGTPGAVTTSSTYNLTFNKPTSITDPLGHTATMTYDGAGNLLSSTDPLGQTTTFGYDNNGELTTTTDPLGNSTVFSYLNGDVVSITDPLGRTTQQAFDAVDRITTSTDPMGRATQYQYDPLNRLVQTTDPLGNPTSLTYDRNGNVLSVTDANQHTTDYTYDSMNRLASRTDPLGHAESYQHDQDGNVTEFTDRRAISTSYTYDPLNRLVQGNFGGQSSIAYSYDAGGRMTQAVDSMTGTVGRSYDGLNRLTAETTPEGSVSYGYDAASRRISLGVSGQAPVGYAYDNDNRVTQISQATSNVTVSYDSDSRRTSLVLSNGATMSYSYDVASQLLGITYQLGTTVLGNLTYTYDLAGNRTTVGGSYAQTGLPSALANASFNADNQLTLFGSSNLTYDANGNLTSDGTHTYTWDARNHLVSISGAVSASFQYDAFDRRVSKLLGAASTSYLYDREDPVQELSGGTPTANLLIGLRFDERFQRTDANGPASFLTDALGSTVALTDRGGNTIARYTYDPYGNTTITGSSTNPYQYTGRENDGTGLYYYRARYYSPATGRFLSEDPIGFGAGVNFYWYARNNPIIYTDPEGLEWKHVTSPYGSCDINDIPDFQPYPPAGAKQGICRNGGAYFVKAWTCQNGCRKCCNYQADFFQITCRKRGPDFYGFATEWDDGSYYGECCSTKPVKKTNPPPVKTPVLGVPRPK
jgi:RHS repeat-associated protein